MRLIILAIFFFGILSNCALPKSKDGIDAWSSADQRIEWRATLGKEATSTILTAFDPVGHLIGLSGRFSVANEDPETIRSWLREHSRMLGLSPDDEVQYSNSRTWFQPNASAEAGKEGAQADRMMFFAVGYAGLFPNPRSIVVILEPGSSPSILGIYNSHYPAINDRAQFKMLSLEDAWKIAEVYNKTSLQRLQASSDWTSVSWLTNRTPGSKEFLWLLTGLDSSGVARVYVVSASQRAVVLAGEQFHSFSYDTDLIKQEHRAYVKQGTIYWDSSDTTETRGCWDVDQTCTEPAYSDSVYSRNEFSLMTEFWRNLSRPAGTLTGWPWNEPEKSPLRITQSNSGGLSQPLTIVVQHDKFRSTIECPPFEPPCGNYTTKWFGPGDSKVDIYGHEFGHSIILDLKSSVGGSISMAGALTEAMADYIGIVSENIRLLTINRQPTAQRTNFKIVSGNGFIVDWTSPSGRCGDGAERGILGNAFYEAWKTFYPGPSTNARDGRFRSWRLAILHSYYLTTDQFPVGRDLYATAIALTYTPVPGRPDYNQNDQAVRALRLALSNTGCWSM